MIYSTGNTLIKYMSNQFTYKPLSKTSILNTYINKDGYSMRDAAKELNCTVKKLWKSMLYHGIKAKSKGAPGKPKKLNYSPDRIAYLKRIKSNKETKDKYGFLPRYSIAEVYSSLGVSIGTKCTNISRGIKLEAARSLGCGYRYLLRLLVAYNMITVTHKKNTNHKYEQLQDKNWVKQSLNVKSIADIAKEIGSSKSAVMNAIKKYNIEIKRGRTSLRGEKNRLWNGGKQVNSNGYIYIYAPDHPKATLRGYVLEHRLVAEKKIGRPIEDFEDVHHINGNKVDNSPDNLEVLSRREHAKRHFDAVKDVARLRELLIKNGINPD